MELISLLWVKEDKTRIVYILRNHKLQQFTSSLNVVTSSSPKSQSPKVRVIKGRCKGES
jgi:hypothetical protein